MDEKQQELFFKMSMFEQQVQQINEQMESVERGISELDSLKHGLEEIKNSKEKEIMASVGKGIFLKSKILSDELLVDVGNKSLVKKSVAETQKMIEDQIKKLREVRIELNGNLETMGSEMRKIMDESEKKSEKI